VVWAINKFRQYIEGYHFRVITDHSCLQWLRGMKNPTSRLARWALDLQGYMFDVEHRKGALHAVPDALSRMYESDDPEISALSWAEETGDDWYLAKLKEVREKPHANPTWKVVGGNLYTYRPEDLLSELAEDDEAWKLVVPRERRRQVLEECHDAATAGHLGREKTLARVSRFYYWPSLYEDTRLYVRGCLVCQQCKVEQRPPLGLMGQRKIERP